MGEGKGKDAAEIHDAAMAAAMVVMEEFFPHCPNGMAQAVHGRVVEIIEAAIESAGSARWMSRLHSSQN